MSRLIKLTPEIQTESEPEGFEFGYYVSDDIGPIKAFMKTGNQ